MYVEDKKECFSPNTGFNLNLFMQLLPKNPASEILVQFRSCFFAAQTFFFFQKVARSHHVSLATNGKTTETTGKLKA